MLQRVPDSGRDGAESVRSYTVAVGGGAAGIAEQAGVDVANGSLSSPHQYAKSGALGVVLGVGVHYGGKVVGAGLDRVADQVQNGAMRRAVDAVFEEGNLNLGTMVKAPAKGLGGTGPKAENGGIWFHDNLTIDGIGPDGKAVELRTHSANPNAPLGSRSNSGYTTQINTVQNNPKRLLPDGSWKTWKQMSEAERAVTHFPAGD